MVNVTGDTVLSVEYQLRRSLGFGVTLEQYPSGATASGILLASPRRVPGLTRSQRRKLVRRARALLRLGITRLASRAYAASGVSVPIAMPPIASWAAVAS